MRGMGARLGAARSSEQGGVLRYWGCRTWLGTWAVATRSPDRAWLARLGLWPPPGALTAGREALNRRLCQFILRDPSLVGLREGMSQ